MDEQLQFLPWVILFLPLVTAVLITLLTLRDGKISGVLSIGSAVIGFLMSLGLWHMCSSGDIDLFEYGVPWLNIGDDLKIEIGYRLDTLSLMMLLVVTGVGGLIHIYSYAYMGHDKAMGRYFAGLSLFMFSMLGIVLANNFVMLFIFWELVGVSSYLLIGHWNERASAADAAKKAFLTNRMGDFGFLLGILMIWGLIGSVKYETVQTLLEHNPAALGSMAGVAGLLIFCGAMGKSAQFPLHVWLPDAMEGPTPVSALIHAATMVAAGVYMLCRVFFLFQVTPAWPESLAFLQGITPLTIISWIGGFTALLAALIAVQQNDIKRILAYSTLSQLGYMVMAVGLNGPTPAMFHLTTHAFFKALLFLGAGSVIMAMHHEQDIWKMGGLWKKMPWTFWTFLIGTLALAGIPPFSGFYSKDAILAVAEKASMPLFILAVTVAGLTAFYMFRLVFVAFLGPVKDQAADHAHESPGIMVWPLRLLAILSAVGGFMGIEALYHSAFVPDAAEHAVPFMEQLVAPFHHAPTAAWSGLAAAVLGIGFAFILYAKAKSDPLTSALGSLSKAMQNRFYFDELYDCIIDVTHEAMSRFADWCDRWIVSGLMVRGTHGFFELTGRGLRLLQTGNIQTYAILFAVGVVAVVYWAVKG